MTESTHTPVPWTTDGRFIVQEVDGKAFWSGQLFIADTHISSGNKVPGQMESDSRFIVQACNAHDDLVKALEIMLQVFNVKTVDPMKAFIAIEKARATIAKATGEQS